MDFNHRRRFFPRIGRTLPPAAVPISLAEFWRGLLGCLRPRRELARFEAELKQFFGVKHCFLVSSGQTALYLILRALHSLHPDCETVVVPAYTCFSVPAAIVRAGLSMQPCDLDSGTMDFDFVRLAEVLERSKGGGGPLCILSTHLFGRPADLGRVRKMLLERGWSGVAVVEDAAQAMGVEKTGGGRLGTLGDVGFFSLGRGKQLSLGEGGIILSNDQKIASALQPLLATLPPPSWHQICRLLLLTGALAVLLRPGLFWLPKGLPWLHLGETVFETDFENRKMSGFQAGLSRGWQVKLQRLQRVRRARTRAWEMMLPPRYAASFSTPAGSPLRFPVRVGSEVFRQHILAQSEREGLGIMPGYPSPVHGISALKERLPAGRSCPRAAALAREILTLPVHDFVSPRDQRKIAALFQGWVGAEPAGWPRRSFDGSV